MVHRVQLQTYPSEDAGFREQSESLLDAGADTPARLQAGLREEYPRARVVEGISEGVQRRWYVYRDGRLVGGGSTSLNLRAS